MLDAPMLHNLLRRDCLMCKQGIDDKFAYGQLIAVRYPINLQFELKSTRYSAHASSIPDAPMLRCLL